MQYELPAILNKSQLSNRLCISERTVEIMAEAMELPPPLRIGNDMHWTELEIERWWESWLDEHENFKH